MKINQIININVFFSILLLLILNTKIRFLPKVGFGEISAIIFFLISFYYSIINKKKIFSKLFNYILLTFIYLILVGLLVSLWGYGKVYGIILFDVFAYVISFLIILSFLINDSFNLEKSLKIFVYIFILFTILNFFLLPSSITLYQNTRFSSISNNPNQLAFAILFSQIIIFNYFEINFKNAFLLLLLFLFGLSTQSDAYIISSLFFYLGYGTFLTFINFKVDKFLTSFLIFLMIILFSLAFFYIFNFDLIKSWNLYDEGGLRISLFYHGIVSWINNPISILFGNGFGRFSGVDFPFNFREAHNTYIDILSNFGIFGFMIIFYPVLRSTIKSFLDENYALFFSTLSFLSYISFHMVARQPFFWIIWFICLCTLRINYKKN